MPSSILNFPTEVILLIIDNVDDTADVIRLGWTCQRLRCIVEPIVWSTVKLQTGKEWVYKLKALVVNPKLAGHVSTFWAEKLNDDGVNMWDEGDAPWNYFEKVKLGSLVCDHASRMIVEFCGLDQENPSNLVGRIIAAFMLLCPNLQTLKLPIPTTDEDAYEELDRVLKILLSGGEASTRHLPPIKDLTIVRRFGFLSEPLGCPHLFHIPTVRRLELPAASGETWEDTNGSANSAVVDSPLFPNLEELILEGHDLDGRQWFHLLTRCKKLEVLAARARGRNSQVFGVDDDWKWLDSGFLGCTGTLRSLKWSAGLSGMRAHYFYDVKPEIRLTCLPALAKLTHLDIDTGSMYGATKNMASLKMRDLLPPSLVSVKITEEFAVPQKPAPEEAGAYRRAMHGDMVELCRREKQPLLEKAQFCGASEYWLGIFSRAEDRREGLVWRSGEDPEKAFESLKLNIESCDKYGWTLESVD